MSRDQNPVSRQPLPTKDPKDGKSVPEQATAIHGPSAPTLPNDTLRPNDGNGNANGASLISATGMPIDTERHTPDELAHASRSRRRVLLKAGLVLMALLLVLDIAYLSPFTDPAAGVPPRLPSPVPLTEVQPYGVNTFLQKEVDGWKKDKTLQMAQNMGAGWIKQQFPWADIEYRQDPGNPYWDVKNNQSAWEKYDSIVSLAQQYGLRVIARIDSAPAWSHPLINTLKAPPSADHMQDFANFIHDFVKKYSGQVAAIQIWNEPNLVGEWATGRPVNPAEYVQLLKTAYIAAKQVDPNMIVLAAPLATTNDTSNNLDELDYLQGMYDAGAKQYFDVMSANAYGKSEPPEAAPSRDKLNFRRVELLRAVMEQNGDSAKAVWFNEYGWNASPDSITNLPWGRVTPDQQADYTVRGIQYAQQHWPWAGLFTIWYLRQVGDIPNTESEYYFGLLDPDFVVSPAYQAVQKATAASDAAATVGAWGPLSSPVSAAPQWRIRLSSTVPGGLSVAPSGIGDTISLSFIGTDVKISLLPAPTDGTGGVAGGNGARYYVTIDGESSKVAPELPRDSRKQAYIQAPTGGQASEITVARGLNAEFRTGLHTLRIRVDNDPQAVGSARASGVFAPDAQSIAMPGIGAITVEAKRSYVLFAVTLLLLIAGIGFLAWVLRRSRSLMVAAHGR
ncbi:MAG: cellulase family glycosylhydrolase [Chloroflexi bacterium]|nr:cellulase family glycosylhydrolase [Chloroflexota bacterium]